MLEKSKRAFKQFISSRWCPLAVAGVALLAVLVIAFLLGFRITYAPEIENSWDAISGVSAWVGIVVSIASAVASFMAVWYAIQIPQRIADKQDRISLFEKRFECYSVILNLIECAKWIEEKTKNREIAISFRANFDLKHLGSEYQIEEYRKNFLEFTIYFYHLQVILVGGGFLFTNYNVKMLQKIIDTGFQLLYETWPSNTDHEDEKKEISKSAMKLKNEFCKACQEYKSTYLDKMSEELTLTKVK